MPPICIVCLELANADIDRNGKPYVGCPSCGTYHFLRTPKAQVAYGIIQEFLRANLETLAPAIQVAYASYLQALQAGAITVQGRPRKRKQ
jgi:hypothetical protein